MFVLGLATMVSVQTSDGQRLFGAKYKEYEHFLIKHAVSLNDPRGDQVRHAGNIWKFSFFVRKKKSLTQCEAPAS